MQYVTTARFISHSEVTEGNKLDNHREVENKYGDSSAL